MGYIVSVRRIVADFSSLASERVLARRNAVRTIGEFFLFFLATGGLLEAEERL